MSSKLELETRKQFETRSAVGAGRGAWGRAWDAVGRLWEACGRLWDACGTLWDACGTLVVRCGTLWDACGCGFGCGCGGELENSWGPRNEFNSKNSKPENEFELFAGLDYYYYYY